MLRKANDCVVDSPSRPAEMIFDEFWRRGEVALMFGASGAGKSLLAMQAAEAIARGCDVAGFRLDAEPGRVLYVDLAMSDAQFSERYLMQGASGAYKPYRFSERLFRDRPPNVDALIPWLRGIVKANAIRYVVIDDLSSVMRTCEGTRETVRAMRLLKELRDELGISILVLMEAADPGRRKWVSEADLGRQAALCRIADSVFAIGRHWQQPEYRYLAQTRSRNSVPRWTPHNTFFGKVDMKQWPTPGFRFENEMDESTREIVREVQRLRYSGATFRAIAKQMGISKSRAARLHMRMLPVRWGEEEGRRQKTEDRRRKAEDGRQEAEGRRQEAGAGRQEAEGNDMSERAEVGSGIRSELDEVLDAVEGSVGTVSSGVGDDGFGLGGRFTTPSPEAGATPPLEGGELVVRAGEMQKPDREGGRNVQVDSIALAHARACAIDGEVDGFALADARACAYGPAACPFLYDGSAAAKGWFRWLLKLHPERDPEAIKRDYVNGEAWCRPPGAVPPYDPENPFKDMEVEVDDRGNERFVETRREDGKAMVWYKYSGHRLRRWKRNGNGIIGSEVNVNLFGRWADLSIQINCH